MLDDMGYGAFGTLKSGGSFCYTAGINSAAVAGGTTCLIPWIGASNLIVLQFSSQMFSSQINVPMILSHFALLESPVSPISFVKVGGGVLMVIGAVMMNRG